MYEHYINLMIAIFSQHEYIFLIDSVVSQALRTDYFLNANDEPSLDLDRKSF